MEEVIWSDVALCSEQSVSQWVSYQGRHRAARAAKKTNTMTMTIFVNEPQEDWGEIEQSWSLSQLFLSITTMMTMTDRDRQRQRQFQWQWQFVVNGPQEDREGGRLNSPKRSVSQLLCRPPSMFSLFHKLATVFSLFHKTATNWTQTSETLTLSMKDLTVCDMYLLWNYI